MSKVRAKLFLYADVMFIYSLLYRHCAQYPPYQIRAHQLLEGRLPMVTHALQWGCHCLALFVFFGLVVSCCLRLGLGDTVHRGDEPGTMGDNLQPVDLGTGKSEIRVSTAGALDRAE